MFDLLNKYKDAIYWYMKKIIRHENTPFDFSFTSLKKKGSALDLNMMRYIHTKIWEAKLCEALVTEHMKEKIVDTMYTLHSEAKIFCRLWYKLNENANVSVSGGILHLPGKEQVRTRHVRASSLYIGCALQEKSEGAHLLDWA